MSHAVSVCIASFGTNDPAALIYDVLWFSDSGKPADSEQELQAGYKCVQDTWDLRQQVLQAEEAAAPCLKIFCTHFDLGQDWGPFKLCKSVSSHLTWTHIWVTKYDQISLLSSICKQEGTSVGQMHELTFFYIDELH